ncbi:MAG: SAM-dependent chlorinase/fluorinase [Acidobacteria bacterium]|nr:SAM-dependent chlorinase/fluorinase [Acidobacteriota bacterium]
MNKVSGIISLLTDFGEEDHYVGTMKGVILGINPSLRLVDITHNIPPHDIYQASYLLSCYYRYFPPGTVHLVVVDPGVGGKRKPIIAVTGSYYFVLPDNGLLSFISAREKVRAFEIRKEKYLITPRGTTFQGRDVFAPAAAHLASGVSPRLFGPKISDFVEFSLPKVEVMGDVLIGEVIHIDRFGNVVTNIDLSFFKRYVKKFIAIEVNKRKITEIKKSYEEGKEGGPFAIFGSSDYLELSVYQGRADELLSVRRGDKILVYFNKNQ